MIKAIETNYAGYRFRSRLEARWAVFFDHLNIKWEYELEGFNCRYHFPPEEGEFKYLPDFWLPELGLWVEVKGSLTPTETKKILNAAACLSAPYGGCDYGYTHPEGYSAGHDLLILGPLNNGEFNFPWVLHKHKGALWAYPWYITKHQNVWEITDDESKELTLREYTYVASNLLEGWRPWTFQVALNKAKSARFEHGESG